MALNLCVPNSGIVHHGDSSTPAMGLLGERRATIATSTMDFKSGEDFDQLNQYKLYDILGKGSFAIVRLAKHKTTGTEYAVKCISKKRLRRAVGFGRPAPKGSPGMLRRGTVDAGLYSLRQEIAILSRLQHPHIVRLFEVIDDDAEDTTYMVLELLKLGPIMDMSRPHTIHAISESQSRVYFRQIALAVEYIHEHGVIHRDIKPSNIMRYSRDIVKLADFGASHEFDRTATHGDGMRSTAGTPAFMAPESVQVSSEMFAGQPVDLWAMGVTLYCFLFGERPFQSVNMRELYAEIRENEPALFRMTPGVHSRLGQSAAESKLQHVSHNAVLLLRKLLDKNPATRASLQTLSRDDWITSGGTEPLCLSQDVTVVGTTVDGGVACRRVSSPAIAPSPKHMHTRSTSVTSPLPVLPDGANAPPTPVSPMRLLFVPSPNMRVRTGSAPHPRTVSTHPGRPRQHTRRDQVPRSHEQPQTASPRGILNAPTETMIGVGGAVKFAPPKHYHGGAARMKPSRVSETCTASSITQPRQLNPPSVSENIDHQLSPERIRGLAPAASDSSATKKDRIVPPARGRDGRKVMPASTTPSGVTVSRLAVSRNVSPWRSPVVVKSRGRPGTSTALTLRQRMQRPGFLDNVKESVV
eukprot:m.62216 g.62216  ORF g.62216 m.62216 type:complete len:639 (-) comp15792_c0_seq11:1708-3624(-)